MANAFFQTSTYKRSQGRIARQATFATVAGAIAIGAWRFSETMANDGPLWQYGIPTVILLLGIWIGFRLVQWPKFADFLIAVEAEMYKVSWPTRAELFRASMVVLVTIFILAGALFIFDLIWAKLFQMIGIIG